MGWNDVGSRKGSWKAIKLALSLGAQALGVYIVFTLASQHQSQRRHRSGHLAVCS